MQSSDIATLAEHFLELYRDAFLIDPFYRITIEISEGAWISKCIADSAPLTWKINLNPGRHSDMLDVKCSIIDGLLQIMFAGLDAAFKKDDSYQVARDAIIARLGSVLGNVLPDDKPEIITADESAQQGE